MSEEKINPKLLWRKKQIDAGNCAWCGQKRERLKRLCNSCDVKQKAYQAQYKKKKAVK